MLLAAISPEAKYAGLGGNSGSTAIAAAAGSTGTISIKNNTGGDFYATRMKLRAYLSATQNTAIAGTPLLESPTAKMTDNTMPSNDLVTANFKVGQDNFFNAEVPLSALRDQGGWFEFRDILPKIPSNQEVTVTLTNNSGYTLTVSAFFDGFSVPQGKAPFRAAA